MLKNTLMLLLLMTGLLACGESNREAENDRPEPVIETEIDLDGVNDTTGVQRDSLSPQETPAMPYGTGENL